MADSKSKRKRTIPERGTPEFDAWRAKLVAAIKGKPHPNAKGKAKPPRTPEHCAKLSAAKQRNPRPPKLLEANARRRGSTWKQKPEAIEKMREAWKSRVWKPEWSERAGRAKAANARKRFWTRLQKTETCWLWTGPVDKDGYGEAGFESLEKKAHRAAYALTFGPIPDGGWILHRCDTPRCCRPDHLYLGTPADNVKDREERRRGERPYQRNGGAA